jgi:lipopolysaccharide biosynthesis glycosyltransferase
LFQKSRKERQKLNHNDTGPSYGHKVKIVHFIGVTKPWHVKFDAAGQPLAGPLEAHTLDHLKQWWNIFHSDVKPKLAELVSPATWGRF